MPTEVEVVLAGFSGDGGYGYQLDENKLLSMLSSHLQVRPTWAVSLWSADSFSGPSEAPAVLLMWFRPMAAAQHMCCAAGWSCALLHAARGQRLHGSMPPPPLPRPGPAPRCAQHPSLLWHCAHPSPPSLLSQWYCPYAWETEEDVGVCLTVNYQMVNYKDTPIVSVTCCVRPW